jgi:hypothetical protein
MIVLALLAGAALYAAFLYALHLVFTRRTRRDVAAGAAFRGRVRKHVLKGAIWS